MTTPRKYKLSRKTTTPTGESFTEKWNYITARKLLFVGTGSHGRAVFKVQPDSTLQLEYTSLDDWWKPISFTEFMAQATPSTN